MTLFTTTNYPVSALVEDINLGKIGLPELQRPFVWPNVNVRNLFDSLYRGYPAGFLLFWETGADEQLKRIGANAQQNVPRLAIVDGQQRLTSLFAVLKGVEVVRANFKKERIRIAFNPLTERFEVADAATAQDKAFIPDISELWKPGTKLISYAQRFLAELKTTREISPEEVDRIEDSIGRLFNLPQYQFVALTLPTKAGGDFIKAETIAEIFVRINGQGKKLNQADFILTLMSVFWDSGRAELESFAYASTIPTDNEPSPFNHFIRPTPDQMLRVTVGLALKRARLESVYAALRGRDAKSGLDNPAKRDEQFGLMQAAQKDVLNLSNWHHFLSALSLAGYRSGKMISSDAAIVFSYVLYLMGVRDYGVERSAMRQAIAEFFFMSALTGRYTSSPETRFESDLALLRDLPDGKTFLNKLSDLSATTLTGDYWSISLPSQLATSASQGPALFAYLAALIKLDADVLFSPLKIASLADPAVTGVKAQIERHHLFPRGFLEGQGVKDLKQINQIGNLAWLEWPANLQISAASPADYAPPLDGQLSAAKREQVYFWHALPALWWLLSYEDFLIARRSRIAQVIEKAWKQLTGSLATEVPTPLSVSELLVAGETPSVEFKSTLRMNLHTGQQDDKIQIAALKTIAAFLNAQGGTLLVGIADDASVLGIDADGFTNEDKMSLHLVNLVKDRIGDLFMPYVHPHFDEQAGKRILVVKCEKGPKPAFVKDASLQRFFVRGGNATTELMGSHITDYVKARFG
jgi:hypothetical protein